MNNTMTNAKSPDDERDWDSIDIYLFSNGQEYSPPRKYHLRADELNWWDATLNHLAKSQFGVMHSAMHLYTLDGHRVEGPLELSNGGAYVAVEPPDTFIDTGYEKYLIKASRSWEKRQAKKSSSNEVTQDAAQIAPNEDPKAEVIASDLLLSIKAPEQDFTLESVINPPMKPQKVPEIQQRTPKTPPTNKQVEKRRTSLSQRVTTFRKVINPPPTPPAKKLAIKTSPPKKITKPIRPINTPQANLIAKSKMYAKSVYKKNTPIDRSKVVERKSTSLTRITSNFKIMSTDSTPLDNFIGDKEIILLSNMYKNPKSDNNSIKINNTVKKEQTGVQYSPEIIRINEEIQSVIDQTAETAQRRLSLQKEDVRNNKIRIVNVTPELNNILPSADDNYITLMNKGDVVNLRLMIEVRNVDNRNVKCRTVLRSQSGFNISKPQRECQDNLDDEVLIQSKSLQSLLENEYSQSIHTEGDTKVVVVRCGCRQYETENDMSRANESMCTCNKRFYILLPKWEENGDRCKRDENLKRNTDNFEQQKEEFRNTSCCTTTPVKQTFLEISSERITESKNMIRRSRDVDGITESINTDRRKSRDTEMVTEPINTERKKSRDTEMVTDPINSKQKESRDTEAFTEPISTERKKSRDIEAISEPIYTEPRKIRDVEAMSEPINTDRRKSRDLEPTSNNNYFPPRGENTNAGDSSKSENCPNAEYTTDEYVVTKQIITEDQAPQSGVTTGQRSSIVSERTEYIVRRKSSVKEPKIYVDNSTQTEMWDILLEARRHEDGRYTFHLPSLYALKQYGL